MDLKKYGHFSKDGREFIITTPNTPRPWINYLTNEKYCAIISHCAGGYSFYRDCRTDRITRWLPENWHFDRPGRYVYLKESKKSNAWSLSYQPTRKRLDFYRCRHGLGYTTIESKNEGLSAEATYFVPRNDDCEVWLIKLKNQTSKMKNLEIYPYIEWLLGDYHLELRYRNIMNLYNRIWFDRKLKAILAKKTAAWGDLNIKNFEYLSFLGSSLAVKGCVTRKDSFLGRYNTEQNPEMLCGGKFKNVYFCSGEDGVGVFRHSLKLAPGAIREFTIVLGQTKGRKNIKRMLNKYRNLERAKKELSAVKTLWQRRIVNNIEVKTPDKEFDLMVNFWVKYQLYICNFWSRSPSYYHEGSGGRGYRDSCQDSESIASINPRFARKRILQIARLIRADGTSAPGWADTSGPAGHRPNKDHQIWLTSTVAAYIKETGDKKILLEKVPYLKDHWIKGWEINEKWKRGPVFESNGTLFEHLEKNLNFCFKDTGKKGFPLIGHADWNDAIDAAGKHHRGESVWLAQALVRSLKILSELGQSIGKKAKAGECLRKAEIMQRRINKFGWDGDWYTRGITDAGVVYGSKRNLEGKIYLNSQSWAILAGVAGSQRLKRVINSVNKYLDGPHGLALFYPAYTKFDSRLGRISMFSEGTKENAAVFCHAATFMAVAYCLSGLGNRAYSAIKKIMPNAQKDYDLYKTEPYVYAEYLVGPGHPYLYGEGAFTWITGTAGWSFMAATEWLLGVQRDYNGLRMSPCIPARWKSCRVRRPFRGAVYEIEIKNPKGKQSGLTSLYCDGKKLDGNLIKPHKDGKTHRVLAVM